jgi:hypothetical protein
VNDVAIYQKKILLMCRVVASVWFLLMCSSCPSQCSSSNVSDVRSIGLAVVDAHVSLGCKDSDSVSHAFYCSGPRWEASYFHASYEEGNQG